MLEVESWILSGMAASIAISLLCAFIGFVTLPGTVATALTIFVIIGVSILASYINAGVAEKLNNELLRLID